MAPIGKPCWGSSMAEAFVNSPFILKSFCFKWVLISGFKNPKLNMAQYTALVLSASSAYLINSPLSGCFF